MVISSSNFLFNNCDSVSDAMSSNYLWIRSLSINLRYKDGGDSSSRKAQESAVFQALVQKKNLCSLQTHYLILLQTIDLQ